MTIDGTVGATGNTWNVYGGGSGTGGVDGGTSGDQAKVVVNGAVIGNVFGGSDSSINTSSITAGGGTSVMISAGATVTEGNVYGGNDTAGSIANGTHVVNAGTIGTAGTPQNLYGGGTGGSIAHGNNTYGTHVTNSGTVHGLIYGGGSNGNIDSTYVTMGAGTVGDDMYGANETSGTVTNTNVNLIGGTVNNVFGGGRNANVTVAETATVSITGTTVINSTKTVYGGGNNGSPTGDTDVTVSVNVLDKNVYGGGLNSPIVDMAASDGSTLIKITGGTIGLNTPSSVYGGGCNTLSNANNARVEGKSSVVVNGATVTKNVYGGGDSAAVKETDVEIQTGAQINGNVFGGGENESTPANRAYVSQNTLVKIKGGTVDLNVYGGGDDDENHVGSTSSHTAEVEASGGAVKGNVYGGGLSSTARNTKVTISGATIGVAGTNGNVFGGGTGTDAKIHNNTLVTVSGGQVGHDSVVDKTATVYGGGEDNLVAGTTTVNVTGGTVYRDVFGGGLDAGGTVNSGASNTNTVSTVTVSGGTVHGGTTQGQYTMAGSMNTEETTAIGGGVYGGGYNLATIFGSTEVTVNGTASIGTNATGNSVYGGGLQALVVGNTKVTVDGTANVYRNVYGGGRAAGDVQGATGTTVNITGGTVHHNVYGGGLDDSKVTSNTSITIGTATVGTAAPADVIYGGGAGLTAATVGGGTTITIGGGATTPTVNAEVHGGGDGSTNHILGNAGTKVTIETGTVTGDVYGGGRNSDVKTTLVTNRAKVDGNVWGGGLTRSNIAAPAPVTAGAKVIITGANGKVTMNVNGGGHSTDGQDTHVDGGTSVQVTDNADVTGNVWGGGQADAGGNADVDAGAKVEVSGNAKVTGSVWGGGWTKAGSTGTALVDDGTVVDILSGAEITGSVYGGGWAEGPGSTEVTGDSKVTVKDSQIKTDLWGGGTGTATQADIDGNVIMIIDSGIVGPISGNVWGGGQYSAITGTVTMDTDGDTVIHGTVHGGGESTVGNENDAKVNDSNGEGTVITITFDGNTNVKGNVYGGGLFGNVYGSIEMDVKAKRFEENIYGGGQNANVEWNTRVHVYENADVGHSVYGGGIKDDPATVPSNTYTNGGYTDVTIDGHIHGSVYGGGHRVDVMNNANQGGKGATVKITTNATIGDNPLIGNDTDNRGTVYGGGRDANIANANHGGTYVHLTGEAEVWWDVYGGGWNDQSGTPGAYGNVAGPEGTYVELKDKSHVHHNIYGGGRNHGDVTHILEGGTVVLLDDECEVGDNQSRGDVFGGGNVGHIMGKNGTKVTLMPYAIVHGTIYGGCYYADVLHPNSGTEVYIYGQVGDTYHTNSYFDARPSFYDGSDLDFYGNPVAKTGNVYGGGHHGNIDGDRGTKMLVTDENSGREKAVVWNSVYGGGFEGDVKFDTVVNVEGAAEVYNSVFGGGQQSENSFQLNPQKALVHKTTTVNVTEPNTKIGHWDMTRLTDNSSLINIVENNDLELHTGRVFGGGDFATVAGNATVTVDSLKQKAFRTISGGSFGVLSINTPDDRNLILKNLGESTGYETNDSEEWGPGIYDDLHYYTVVKHLHDYTRADVEDSFLTVYYHHRSADDNSDFGLKYPGYTMDASSGDYEAKYYGFGGKYHPWRPYPHKDIIVDPIFVPDFSKTATGGESTMFRMQAGYTIDMRPGGIVCSNATIPQLLIDRASRRYTATSKVYGPSNNVVDPTTFIYDYLPNTLSPKNLNDRRSDVICGINFYIPPIEIKPIRGDTTSHGGTDILDKTTGNTGAPEYEATDKTVSVKANEKDLTKKVQAAVDKTAKGKTAYVSESRYDQYTGEILTAVNKAALDAGGKVILMADTMDGNRVQGRMYIDPSKVTGKTINSRVYTISDRISQARVNFQSYYKNSFAFVQLAHEGAIGTEVEIAAKVNLDSLNTKNLIFYTYSTSTNSYKRIENPRYFIDKNGYLHFYTSVGGTVVITDKPLARK